MSRRHLLWLLFAILLLGASARWLWPEESEEDRVRDVIRAVIEGAEQGNAGTVLEPMTPKFRAETGGESLDVSTLRLLLAREFMRRGPIHVLAPEIAVEVTGAHAHASFDALLTEQSGHWTELLPVNAAGWHVELEFDRVDGEWQVARAVRSDAQLLEVGAPE